jgi:hypothetical protein
VQRMGGRYLGIGVAIRKERIIPSDVSV